MLALMLVSCASLEPKRTAVAELKPSVRRVFGFTPAPMRAQFITIPARSPFMPTGQQVLPPMGYIGFCIAMRSACAGGTDEPLPFALTPQRRAELIAVNSGVNALPEISDKELYGRDEIWTYARERGGDCEDLALEKRRRLIALGWPTDALLIATAKDADNEGHAVLIAATAAGDFVLDNRAAEVRLWTDAPYRWLTRQSRERPYVWLSLDEPHFTLHPIASFPPLNRPAPFLDQTIMASRKTAPLSLFASSEATQAHRLPELRR